MVQLSATRLSYIAILLVSVVSFAAITLCVASQRVFIVVYFVIDSVRKFLDTSSCGSVLDYSFLYCFYTVSCNVACWHSVGTGKYQIDFPSAQSVELKALPLGCHEMSLLIGWLAERTVLHSKLLYRQDLSTQAN
jgi:hypothetical protein